MNQTQSKANPASFDQDIRRYAVTYGETHIYTVIVDAATPDEAKQIVADGGIDAGEPDEIRMDGDMNDWNVEDVTAQGLPPVNHLVDSDSNVHIGRMLDAEDIRSSASSQEQFNGEAFDVVFLPRRTAAMAIARGICDADTDNADENDLQHFAEQGCLLADHLVTAEKRGAKVFVVAIDHKYGMDSSVFVTRAAAEHYLFGYVTEWWDKDGPRGEDIPTDQTEAIDRYFHHDDSRDSYTLNECEVRS